MYKIHLRVVLPKETGTCNTQPLIPHGSWDADTQAMWTIVVREHADTKAQVHAGANQASMDTAETLRDTCVWYPWHLLHCQNPGEVMCMFQAIIREVRAPLPITQLKTCYSILKLFDLSHRRVGKDALGEQEEPHER